MTSPADLVNRALDAIGADYTIGDIEEGGKVQEIVRRAYVPARQQLLRTARWNFCRKQADLVLLAERNHRGDSGGGGEDRRDGGISHEVIWPWRYEYQYPIDCLQVRFVPHNHRPRQVPGSAGLTPGGAFVNQNQGVNYVLGGVNTIGSESNRGHRQLRPGRFLVAIDPNYPGLQGAITDNSQMPDFGGPIGVGPTGRTVILTDIRHAQAVYTADIEYPDEWDAQFQEAFVAYLANLICIPVTIALDKDKKFGADMEQRTMLRAKSFITAARITDANEGIQTTDSTPDWIHGRFRGGVYGGGSHGSDGGDGGGGEGGGDYGSGVFTYDSTPIVFGNGSTY
jgi:hypothetical protein